VEFAPVAGEAVLGGVQLAVLAPGVVPVRVPQVYALMLHLTPVGLDAPDEIVAHSQVATDVVSVVVGLGLGHGRKAGHRKSNRQQVSDFHRRILFFLFLNLSFRFEYENPSDLKGTRRSNER
jgi:hypothetical protein